MYNICFRTHNQTQVRGQTPAGRGERTRYKIQRPREKNVYKKESKYV